MLSSLAFGAKAITAAQVLARLSNALTKDIEWRFSGTPECSRGIFKTKYLLNGLKSLALTSVHCLYLHALILHTPHMHVNTYVCVRSEAVKE